MIIINKEQVKYDKMNEDINILLFMKGERKFDLNELPGEYENEKIAILYSNILERMAKHNMFNLHAFIKYIQKDYINPAGLKKFEDGSISFNIEDIVNSINEKTKGSLSIHLVDKFNDLLITGILKETSRWIIDQLDGKWIDQNQDLIQEFFEWLDSEYDSLEYPDIPWIEEQAKRYLDEENGKILKGDWQK